tara:strand:+ start:1307 stop:1801 length:495 start_codon:yes stop_codon:yes gene_type:complete
MNNIIEPDFGVRAFRGDKRKEYLQHLRNGMGRKQAARASGVGIRTVQRYVNQNPDWESERDEAESEAIELVENALFNTAVEGNVSAGIFFLTNRSPDRWTDKRRPNINLNAQAAIAIGDGEHEGVVGRMIARAEALLTEGEETDGERRSSNIRELGSGTGGDTN